MQPSAMFDTDGATRLVLPSPAIQLNGGDVYHLDFSNRLAMVRQPFAVTGLFTNVFDANLAYSGDYRTSIEGAGAYQARLNTAAEFEFVTLGGQWGRQALTAYFRKESLLPEENVEG